jgi:hypothetical protein
MIKAVNVDDSMPLQEKLVRYRESVNPVLA